MTSPQPGTGFPACGPGPVHLGEVDSVWQTGERTDSIPALTVAEWETAPGLLLGEPQGLEETAERGKPTVGEHTMPAEPAPVVFKSKVDLWLVPLLLLPPLATLGIAVQALASGKLVDIASSVGTLVFVGAIYGGLVFPLRYVLGHGWLEIQNGLCRKRVALAELQSVRPTRNPLSSPALSLDRLEVRWGPGLFQVVLISPTPRDEFLRQLTAQAGLVPEGAGWIRPPSTSPAPGD